MFTILHSFIKLMFSITVTQLLSDFVLKIAKVATTLLLSKSWHALHLRSYLQATKCVCAGHMQDINVCKKFGWLKAFLKAYSLGRIRLREQKKGRLSGQIPSQNITVQEAVQWYHHCWYTFAAVPLETTIPLQI